MTMSIFQKSVAFEGDETYTRFESISLPRPSSFTNHTDVDENYMDLTSLTSSCSTIDSPQKCNTNHKTLTVTETGSNSKNFYPNVPVPHST